MLSGRGRVKKIKLVTRKVGMLVWSVDGLRSVYDPMRHIIGLKYDRAIYYRPGKLSPKNNPIMDGEVGQMWESGVFVLTTTTRSLHTPITTKMMENGFLC